MSDHARIGRLTPNKAILEELGQRLARIRKQKKISQESLASEAGVGVATLRRIEDGRDSQLGSWIKILKALHMEASIESLLPAVFKSPMAEALAEGKARSRQKESQRSSAKWGDEEQ